MNCLERSEICTVDKSFQLPFTTSAELSQSTSKSATASYTSPLRDSCCNICTAFSKAVCSSKIESFARNTNPCAARGYLSLRFLTSPYASSNLLARFFPKEPLIVFVETKSSGPDSQFDIPTSTCFVYTDPITFALPCAPLPCSRDAICAELRFVVAFKATDNDGSTARGCELPGHRYSKPACSNSRAIQRSKAFAKIPERTLSPRSTGTSKSLTRN